MKLVDALKSGAITWDDLERYSERVKEFETDGYIVQRESHTLAGYKGKAFALQLFTEDLTPMESLSWFAWDEVNSISKMKSILGI